uniref:Mariner Mos1 transposase n=1 Tax=Acrobeloides nanus TaxID=290746 RepID=A0A914C724_9BILA
MTHHDSWRMNFVIDVKHEWRIPDRNGNGKRQFISNSDVYLAQLDRLKAAIKAKRNRKKNHIVFHHDNARPHVEGRVVQSINDKGWDLLEHSLYPPTEYHVNRSLKNWQMGKVYNDLDELVADVKSEKLNAQLEIWDRNAPSTSIKASLFNNESYSTQRTPLHTSNPFSVLTDALKSIGQPKTQKAEKKTYSNYLAGRKNEVVIRRNLSELIEKARHDGLIFTIPQTSQSSSLQLAMAMRKLRKNPKLQENMSKELRSYVFDEDYHEEPDLSKANKEQDPIRVEDSLELEERLSDDDEATELSTDEELSNKPMDPDKLAELYFLQHRARTLALGAKTAFRIRAIEEEIAQKQQEILLSSRCQIQNAAVDEANDKATTTTTSARCRPFLNNHSRRIRHLVYIRRESDSFDSPNVVCKNSDYANVDDSLPPQFFSKEFIPLERRMQKYLRKFATIPTEMLIRRMKETSAVLKKRNIVPGLIEDSKESRKKKHLSSRLKKQKKKRAHKKTEDESSTEANEVLESSSDGENTEQVNLSLRIEIPKEQDSRKSFSASQHQSIITPSIERQPVLFASQFEPNLFSNTAARLPANVEYQEVPVPDYRVVDLFSRSESSPCSPCPASNLVGDLEKVHTILENNERRLIRGKKNNQRKAISELKSSTEQQKNPNKESRRRAHRKTVEKIWSSGVDEEEFSSITQDLEMTESEEEEEDF